MLTLHIWLLFIKQFDHLQRKHEHVLVINIDSVAIDSIQYIWLDHLNQSYYSGSGKFVIFPNTIFFRHHKWITILFFSNTTTKVIYLQLCIWFVFGAARLVVFRLVGCLRQNVLAGCWDGSMLLDLWGMCLKSLCIFVCLVFLGRVCVFSIHMDQKWKGD